MAKRDGIATYHKRLYTAWLAGWDAAVIYRPCSSCPYKRHDLKRWWLNGWKACEEDRVDALNNILAQKNKETRAALAQKGDGE